jgi:erythromycin esterase-like protein
MRKESRDYGPLLDSIGDAQIVLIGEASHGTAEFYQERASITRQLIKEKGFKAVAVESDWPDAYRVNRFLHGVLSRDADAIESLGSYRRYPIWMWRNNNVVEFISWAKSHNQYRELNDQISFLGLDLYSLYSSATMVLRYLQKNDPSAAKRAAQVYDTFMRFGDDTQSYGYAASMGLTPSCEAGCIKVLQDMHSRASEYLRRDGYVGQDELFFNTVNANVVRNAESYYRAMFSSRDNSWNLRDTHMVDTLDAFVSHQKKITGEEKPKVVVWAHNSHLGDAKHTSMSSRREVNVGQLVRERYGEENCFNIGFTTHTGTVMATDGWDQVHDPRGKNVNASIPGSWEHIFHSVSDETKHQAFYITFYQIGGGGKHPISGHVTQAFSQVLMERAIGVIYRPETEVLSHYFKANLAKQFDAIIHIDVTRAVKPLDSTWSPRDEDETVPETFPEGV